MNKRTRDKDLQGEGNYDATRRYDKGARAFVQAGKVDEAAHAAEPGSPGQAEGLKRAEEVGKPHSKGEIPSIEQTPRSPKK